MANELVADQGKIEKLRKLIEGFRLNIKELKNPNYDEANVRVDFIDKFFEILGWDVRNDEGATQEFREVIREDTVEVAGKPKAPDYGFMIGGKKIFFVEAKKPSIDIKDAIEPAYQVRRYGYSAKLPISALTDFEQLAIYDTRIKPHKNDKAGVARVFYCHFEDYEKNFETICSVLSKEAIKKGSLNKYLDEAQVKRGTSEIDREFLELIEDWRIHLAKNLALRNKKITIQSLNCAVQKIIDRIIFLRIAEDRGVENYGNLLAIAKEKDIYQSLNDYFIKADKKYNGEFFKQDSVLNLLKIDKDVFGDIINSLYYPDCPYELSVLPIEILGSIYECFLGKTIHLTPSHQARIEEKPEVKKTGGVYYTPQYIVDYIVINTVGEKIKGKTPKQIEKIKVLDPACGSGSFLIGTYSCLLNYHLQYYKNNPENLNKALKDNKLYRVKDNYLLTIQEKQCILLNNIFGVDIDPQAVEVTKLSLLLKLMEGESQESTGSLFRYSEIKLLPNLSGNIKCGNSLIESDYFRNKNLSLFENGEIQKINAFDWRKQFPEIFKNGGFDIAIGNPPYGADLLDDERSYLEKKFTLNNTDTACLFMGLALNLLNNYGINGYIIPKPFVYASNWETVREKFLNNISEIADCRKVWKEVKLEQVIYFYNKANKVSSYKSCIRNNQNIIYLGDINKETFKKFGFYLNGISTKELNIAKKITGNSIPFTAIGYISRGQDIQNYLTTIKYSKPIYRCKSIGRYLLKETEEGITLDSYKKIKNEISYMEKPKIVIQNIIAHIENPIDRIMLMATIDNEGVIGLGSIGNIFLTNKDYDCHFVIALINSKLMSWYAYRFIYGKAIRTMRFDNCHLEKIPFPKINLKNISDKERYEKINSLASQMIGIQKRLYSIKPKSDDQILQQKAELIDNQIDALVYELYGLNEEEIRIIENSQRKI